MGKRRKKGKASDLRGFNTGKVTSLNEKMGITGAKEDVATVKKTVASVEKKSEKAAAAKEPTEPRVEDEEEQSTVVVDKDYEVVFSNRALTKSKRVRKAACLQGNELGLSLPLEVEERATVLFRRLDLMDDDTAYLDHSEKSENVKLKVSQSWANVESVKMRAKLLRTLLDLEDLGVKTHAAEKAVERCGYDFDAALDWLVLHAPESDLPKGWCPVKAKVSDDAQDFKFIGGSVDPVSSRENDEVDVQPPKPPSPPKVKQKPPTKKEKAISELEKQKQKDMILQYYAMQQEEEEEAAMRGSVEVENQYAGLGPLEKYFAMDKSLLELIEKAKTCAKEDKRFIGAEIKQLKSEIEELRKTHAEVGEAASNKQVKEKIMKPVKEDVEEENDLDAGGFGALFIEDDSDAAVTSSTVSGICIELDKSNSSKSEPKALLEAHVKSKYPKGTAVKFSQIKPSESSARIQRWSVSFGDVIVCMDATEYSPTKAIAQNYVSLKALFEVASEMNYHLQLGPVARRMWLDWKGAAEKARKLELQLQKQAKTSIVESVIQRCFIKPDNSNKKDLRNDTVVLSDNKSRSESKHKRRVQNHDSDSNAQSKLETRRKLPKYQQFEQERASLPVLSIQEKLFALLSSNNVVVVSGTTGSGKTTQIPRMIFENETLNGRGSLCNIACTEPRRISAISVAERVSDELADPKPFGGTGTYVGYQIRGEKKSSGDCRIMYCTTGILLRLLQSDPYLHAFSHIVVDEVHERTVDSDFLLVILRRILRDRNNSSRDPLKVILMSATIDLDKLSSYFDNAPVLEAGGRTYPVTRFPLEDCVELTGYVCETDSEFCKRHLRYQRRDGPSYTAELSSKMGGGRVEYQKGDYSIDFAIETGLDANTFKESTLETIYRMDQARVNYDLIVELLVLIVFRGQDPTQKYPFCSSSSEHSKQRFARALQLLEDFEVEHRGDTRVPKGAILVFLPGLHNIQTLYDRLSHHRIFSNPGKFRVLRLHSSLSSSYSEQRQVFEIPGGEITKIVLSTNIAETGVTIPDVAFVVDSGRVKQTGFQPSRQMECLEETFVSRASLTQRAGRAGRVKPGLSFQLVSTPLQHSKMLEFQQPEIQRVALQSVCLQILSMEKIQGMNPWKFLSEALDPPVEKSVDSAMDNLVEAGALLLLDGPDPETEPLCEKTPQLTALGLHLASFPLDIKIGKMLVYGAIFKCLDPILTVAATIGQEDKLFVSPPNKGKQASEMQKKFKHPFSDLLTYHNVYRAWRLAVFKDPSADSRFCRSNFLSQRTLKEVRKTKGELLDMLKRMGFAGRSCTLDPFVKTKPSIAYPEDDEMNIHSGRDPLLCSILCAGLFPNVAMITPTKKGLDYVCKSRHSNREENVSLVDKSVNTGKIGPNKPLSTNLHLVGWLVYLSKMKMHKRVLLWDSTFIPHLALALFGGSYKISFPEHAIVVDRWIKFRVTPKTATVLKFLRGVLNNFLMEKFKSPQMSTCIAGVEDHILELIVDFLSTFDGETSV